jgi:leucyl-tRNA synthetase
LQRAYRLFVEDTDDGERLVDLADGPGTPDQQRLAAKAIDGVTQDVEAMRFNTAISKLMVFSREVVRDAALPREIAEVFILLLSPFAPHLAEEFWQRLGHSQSLAAEPWPMADAALLEESMLTLAVQVNGKRRDEIEVPADADEETIRRAALASPGVARQLGDREPKRVIIVPGRLVNIVG